MPKQPQLPVDVPHQRPSPELAAAQKAIASPRGDNEILKAFNQLALGYNANTGLCTMNAGYVDCRPGCVLVKSASLGNFLATDLGWEHFPIINGRAATPHYALWATAVFML